MWTNFFYKFWPGLLAGFAALFLCQAGRGLPPGDDDPPPPLPYGGEITTDSDFTADQPPTPGLIQAYKQGLKTGKHTLADNLVGAVKKYLRTYPEADPDRAPSTDSGARAEPGPKKDQTGGGGEQVRGKPAEELDPVPESKPQAAPRPAGRESGQGAASAQGGTAVSGAGPSRQERSRLGHGSAGLTQKLAGRMAGWLKPAGAGLEESPAGALAARAGRPGAASSSRGASGQEPMAGGLSAQDFRLLARDIPNNPGERIFKDIAVSPEGLRYSRSCELVSGRCNPLARDSYQRGHRVRLEHAASLADVWKQLVEEATVAEEASYAAKRPGDRPMGDRLARWLGSGGLPGGLFGEGRSAGPEGAAPSGEGLPAARDSRRNPRAYARGGLGATRARETSAAGSRNEGSSSQKASAVGVWGLRAPGGFGFLLAFLVGGAALLLLRPRGR